MRRGHGKPKVFGSFRLNRKVGPQIVNEDPEHTTYRHPLKSVTWTTGTPTSEKLEFPHKSGSGLEAFYILY